MFSGIIQEIGTITALKSKNGLLELTISCEKISDIEIGDSIAVDGCCQTVTEIAPRHCEKPSRFAQGKLRDEAIQHEVLSREVKTTKGSNPVSGSLAELGTIPEVSDCRVGTKVPPRNDAKQYKLFTIQATQETLDKTNFKELKVGSLINLESSLRMGDKISGHLVSGHVDAIGIVYDIEEDQENRIVKIEYPKELNKYIANKGSVTVNGTSLTVISSKINENFIFTFTLIPFSRDNTNLGLIKKGNPVNLEIDLISRYLVNYLESSNLPVRA